MTILGIGPLEFIIILIIALIVVGPERLPEMMRTVGLWVRRARRTLDDLRAEARAELGQDYDYVEEQVRNLRALNPRRQIQELASSLLEEPAQSPDGPTIRPPAGTIPTAPKLAAPAPAQRQILDLASQALNAEVLDRPLEESLPQPQQTG